MNRSIRRLPAVLFSCLAVACTATPAAQAAPITWKDCGDGYQCGTISVPLDYSATWRGNYKVALIKRPASGPGERIGSLLTNPGGPGGSGVEFVRRDPSDPDSWLFKKLNERYDIVGFDPRGVGESQSPIDCKVNQETDGVYAQPFTTPDNVDANALRNRATKYADRCLRLNDLAPYFTTANVARDMDQIRAAVGDQKLNYIGFSYGTFLGATYENLFPGRTGRFVLDGPVDADDYINRPMDNLDAQTSAFERSIDRFLQACARDQAACRGFGGEDPDAALDDLIDRADANPIDASGWAADPRPVDGDDIRGATMQLTYNKGNWPFMARMLAAAEGGNGALVRYVANFFYDRQPDGTFGPGADRYFVIGANEQQYPYGPWSFDTFLKAGRSSWSKHPRYWLNNGYAEAPYGFFNTWENQPFRGSWKLPQGAPTPLVVATTYDPATPYRGARNLVRDLGNARLLTMTGDGHCAYGGNSTEIDAAVETYLFDGTLPEAGTRYRQQVPFSAPAAAQRRAATADEAVLTRNGTKSNEVVSR